MLLGRGHDFAWSATSAGQDIIDTWAEQLCEPGGGTPTVQSNHYLYKGTCRPMETLTRTNAITPNPADPSPPETFVLTAQRTVHGIVHKRGTVNGKPVAFVKQRSTYFHEVDSARGFSDLNRPAQGHATSRTSSAPSPRSASRSTGSTPTTATSRYFNSGDNPVRAPRRQLRPPNWGTGQWDWQGFNPTTQTAQLHAARASTRRRSTRAT